MNFIRWIKVALWGHCTRASKSGNVRCERFSMRMCVRVESTTFKWNVWTLHGLFAYLRRYSIGTTKTWAGSKRRSWSTVTLEGFPHWNKLGTDWASEILLHIIFYDVLQVVYPSQENSFHCLDRQYLAYRSRVLTVWIVLICSSPLNWVFVI